MASVDGNDLFPVRTINFLGRDVPTLGQNEFGPCALLGVVNALLLRGTLKVSSDHGALTLQDVLARLADRLVEANQAAQDNPDVRAALDGAVTRLPTLAEGLDVNVKFNGGFEFTSDLAIFDLLEWIVHGWRVDGENDPDSLPKHWVRRELQRVHPEVVSCGRTSSRAPRTAGGACERSSSARRRSSPTPASRRSIYLTRERGRVLYRNLHSRRCLSATACSTPW